MSHAMKRLVCLLVVLATFTGSSALACTGFYVGKEASADGTTIIGLDKSCTLEMVQAGEIVTDYDKLIDRQMERAGISAITGFAQLVADSAKGITYTVGG